MTKGRKHSGARRLDGNRIPAGAPQYPVARKRDGARAGATAYGGAQPSIIQDAVLASATDLPALANTSGYLRVTSDSQSITVHVQYSHVLITPVLRQLWSGGRGVEPGRGRASRGELEFSSAIADFALRFPRRPSLSPDPRRFEFPR